MSKVRRKNVRTRVKTTESKQESNYRWCFISKYQIAKCFCEERCMDKKCPIVRKKLEKKKKEELERKRKEFKKEGISRSMLLKPEDRIGGNKK